MTYCPNPPKSYSRPHLRVCTGPRHLRYRALAFLLAVPVAKSPAVLATDSSQNRRVVKLRLPQIQPLERIWLDVCRAITKNEELIEPGPNVLKKPLFGFGRFLIRVLVFFGRLSSLPSLLRNRYRTVRD